MYFVLLLRHSWKTIVNTDVNTDCICIQRFRKRWLYKNCESD